MTVRAAPGHDCNFIVSLTGSLPALQLRVPEPHEIATGFFAESRIATDYAESVRVLSPDWQKLACNMLLVAAGALPRGGRLVLSDAPLTVEALGDGAALSAEAREALALAAPVPALTARTVQPYFTGLLAKALEMSIDGTEDGGRVCLRAVPTAQ
jgi:histidine phosphotransferase ChpT